ncbi:hypothetical protein, partial [Escherichia coli]|uniref:hypothetical protein n=1 Tax=Escherichia coli TaxID=562 RepID=UPI003CCB89F8
MKITNYILPTSRTHGSFSTIKSWDTMNYIKHLIRHTSLLYTTDEDDDIKSVDNC